MLEALHLGKAALTAPLYISVAWSLIISYQLLTQAAVYSAITFVYSVMPSAGGVLFSRIDIIVFIHAFAWIFVLSSAIPSVILGRGRSVLLQFLICLSLTLVAFSIEEVLTDLMGTSPNSQLQILSAWFQNPLLAGLYLSAPYVLMLYIDIRSRRSRREDVHQEGAVIAEQVVDPEKRVLPDGKGVAHEVEPPQTKEPRRAGPSSEGQQSARVRYLYGAGALCFFLALLTLWLDRFIFSAGLTSLSKLVYVALFLGLGSLLIFIGYYATDNHTHSI
ncbi:MAG: hypothetical protein NWE78_07940 [Candidatus Bathyarchaeota archaeon]|nr:hypothetical protein [Candidatus Bathyarchaeota archaeon]